MIFSEHAFTWSVRQASGLLLLAYSAWSFTDCHASDNQESIAETTEPPAILSWFLSEKKINFVYPIGFQAEEGNSMHICGKPIFFLSFSCPDQNHLKKTLQQQKWIREYLDPTGIQEAEWGPIHTCWKRWTELLRKGNFKYWACRNSTEIKQQGLHQGSGAFLCVPLLSICKMGLPCRWKSAEINPLFHKVYSKVCNYDYIIFCPWNFLN